MTDVAVTYSLAAITFNNGAVPGITDIYYLTNIQGLDMPPIRAPIDNAPQQDGGIVHKFWKGPRHIAFEGAFLIQSTRIQTGIQTIRNTMTDALQAQLEGMLQADATLSWTPLGSSAHSLACRCDIPLQTDGTELRTFTFGLVAADPDPVLST